VNTHAEATRTAAGRLRAERSAAQSADQRRADHLAASERAHSDDLATARRIVWQAQTKVTTVGAR